MLNTKAMYNPKITFKPTILRYLQTLVVVLLLLGLTACATIRPETVQLSAEVGSRLSEMEGLHQLAVQRYFDSEIEKVEHFLSTEWEPLFLRNFIGTSGILQMLSNPSRIGEREKAAFTLAIGEYIADPEQAAAATDRLLEEIENSRRGEPEQLKAVLAGFVGPDQVNAAATHLSAVLASEEPGQLMLEWAAAAHQEMNAQREEMLAPLLLAKAEAISELSSAYASLIQGQSTITGRLDAASKLYNEQGKVLQLLGGNKTADGILNKLSNLSARVDNTLQLASKSLGVSADGEADVAGAIVTAFNEHINGLFGREAAGKQ